MFFNSGNLQKRFDKFDVTVAQWPVLYALYQENCATPAEFADYLGLYRSAISRLLARLAKKALAKRENCSMDKRSLRIMLTKEGCAIVPKLAKISSETNNHILSGLSDDEIMQIDQILKKISKSAEQ